MGYPRWLFPTERLSTCAIAIAAASIAFTARGQSPGMPRTQASKRVRCHKPGAALLGPANMVIPQQVADRDVAMMLCRDDDRLY